MPSCNNSSNHIHNVNEDKYCPVNRSAKVVIYKDIEYNGITLSVGVCCPNAGHELIISNEIKKNNGEFKIEERNNEYILQKKNGNNYVDIQNLKQIIEPYLGPVNTPLNNVNYGGLPLEKKTDKQLIDDSQNCLNPNRYDTQGNYYSKCSLVNPFKYN